MSNEKGINTGTFKSEVKKFLTKKFRDQCPPEEVVTGLEELLSMEVEDEVKFYKHVARTQLDRLKSGRLDNHLFYVNLLNEMMLEGGFEPEEVGTTREELEDLMKTK